MANQPTIELWRIGIVALARWACGYSAGRGKSDPVYVEVTENEHGVPRAKYSSCADLAHWIAKRIGVRAAWVNRTDDDFGSRWTPGVNVSKLCSVARVLGGAQLPEPGDFLVLWNRPDTQDAHVCVYLGADSAHPGQHLTANYGAGGMSPAEFPGARIASKPMRVEGSALMYGAKRVQRILTVPRLVAMRNAPVCFSGPEYDADFTGEVQDALEGS